MSRKGGNGAYEGVVEFILIGVDVAVGDDLHTTMVVLDGGSE